MILNPAKRELLAAELLEAEGLSHKSRSLTGDALRRLSRNKAAVVVHRRAGAPDPGRLPRPLPHSLRL